MPGLARLSPTQYRFRFLIERARQLVQLAQQMESALLSALVQRDAVALFGVQGQAGRPPRALRADAAGSDGSSSRGRVRADDDPAATRDVPGQPLHDAVERRPERPRDREPGPQRHRARPLDRALGIALHVEPALRRQACRPSARPGRRRRAIAATLAQYERRREDWLYQRTAGAVRVSTANQQQIIAQDRVQIATQERAVTELKTTIAEDTRGVPRPRSSSSPRNWLPGWWRSTKASAEPAPGWRPASPRLASTQLAFERQEESPAFIQPDYSRGQGRPDERSRAEAPDRKGLTGSARLLNDIELLDQHAFDTDQAQAPSHQDDLARPARAAGVRAVPRRPAC